MQIRFARPGHRSGWLWAALGLGLAAAGAGCYPGGPTDLSELDVVVTSFDESFDFTQPTTYAMPDSIARIGDPDEPGYVEIPDTYDDLILDQVEAELNAYGWQRIPDPENQGADLFALVSVVGSTTWVLTSYYPGWGYWGWYPGWGYYPVYGPGWGWGYPPYYSASSYQTGTVFIDLADPNAGDPVEMTVPIRWTGTLNAVLGSSLADPSTRITKGIHQAFVQSPYLIRN